MKISNDNTVRLLLSKKEKIEKILLDTNILRYLLSPISAFQIELFMTKLVKEGARFAISEASIFELLQAADKEKEKRGTSILNQFKSFPIDKKVLIEAARLAGIYQRYGGINLKGFDIGDLYIATTSIMYFSSILTANQKDYPHPVFQEQESFSINTKNKFNRTEYISIYLLKPNYEFLKEKLITRM